MNHAGCLNVAFSLIRARLFYDQGIESPLIQTMNKFNLCDLIVWKILGDLIYMSVDLHFSFGVTGNNHIRTDFIRISKSDQQSSLVTLLKHHLSSFLFVDKFWSTEYYHFWKCCYNMSHVTKQPSHTWSFSRVFLLANV